MAGMDVSPPSPEQVVTCLPTVLLDTGWNLEERRDLYVNE